MNRILFFQEEIDKPLSLDDSRSLHIINILKLSEGDEISAGIVNGPFGKARITEINSGGIHFQFDFKGIPEPLSPLTLMIGLPRPPTTQRLLKDLTTIGVGRIIFIASDNTEKSYLSGHLWKGDKYRDFLVDGAQQAMTTAVPSVEKYYSVHKALSDIPEHSFKIVLTPSSVNTPETFSPEQGCSCFLAVGPERGWSEREISMFREKGFIPFCLNNRVLRTETACLLGSGLILSKMGFIHSP